MKQVILTQDFNTIEDGVKAITKQVNEGNIEPNNAYLKLKYLSKVCSDALKNIEDLAIDEIDKFGSGEVDINGCKVQVKNSPTRYDFSEITEIIHLEAQLKSAKHKYKELLKALPEKLNYKYGLEVDNTTFVDEESGEEIKLPKVLKGKRIISVKYPKKSV